MMISFSDRRLPISLLVSKALLIVKALSDITFGIKSAFDSKSAFRYHFWMQKCKIGAFGKTNCGGQMPQATSLHIDYTSSQGHPARPQTNVTGNETEWLEKCTKYRLALPSYDLFALFATFLSQASIKLSWLISSFWLQSTCTSQPLCASPADLPQC